jgi:hypothetical protein
LIRAAGDSVHAKAREAGRGGCAGRNGFVIKPPAHRKPRRVAWPTGHGLVVPARGIEALLADSVEDPAVNFLLKEAA